MYVYIDRLAAVNVIGVGVRDVPSARVIVYVIVHKVSFMVKTGIVYEAMLFPRA